MESVKCDGGEWVWLQESGRECRDRTRRYMILLHGERGGREEGGRGGRGGRGGEGERERRVNDQDSVM